MAKRNFLKGMLPVLGFLAISAAIGVTGAAVIHSMKLENPIKTPSVEGEIKEELTDGAKEVWFTNTGEADVFLRVAYSETWTSGNDILPLEAWKKDGSDTVLVAKPNWINTEQWETDGTWLYYKKVLKAGTSTPLIADQVKFVDKEVLDTLTDGIKYQEGVYDLHFTMEIVQASDDAAVSNAAVKELFDMELGLTEQWSKEDWIDWPKADSWAPQ